MEAARERLLETEVSFFLQVAGQEWKGRKILVVGCGAGAEAVRLAEASGADVTGIDVFGPFLSTSAVRLVQASAEQLPFPDQTFDAAYSFHVLEHVPAPQRACAEVHRVLKDNGPFFLGTPNKQRLLGYLNSGQDLRSIVRWNLADWRQRLRGRWQNPEAHAGFTAEELAGLVSGRFLSVKNVAPDYYRFKYRNRPRLLKLVARGGRFLYPGVYCLARK